MLSWIELLSVRDTFEARLKTIKRNYKEKETLVERGTKRFQERLAEEKEAEKELKEYEHNLKEEYIDDSLHTFP